MGVSGCGNALGGVIGPSEYMEETLSECSRPVSSPLHGHEFEALCVGVLGVLWKGLMKDTVLEGLRGEVGA